MKWLTRFVHACIAFRRGATCRQALRIGDTVYMPPDYYGAIVKELGSNPSSTQLGYQGLTLVPCSLLGPRYMTGKEAFLWVLKYGRAK